MSEKTPTQNMHSDASTTRPDTTGENSTHNGDTEKGPQNAWGQGGAGGPPTFPDGGTRAWLVVLGGMIINACSFGYLSAFGVYETYYRSNQLSSKSDSDIAWIGSIQICFQFGSGLIAGSLFDRVGARALLIPATIIYVFSIMMTSLCKEYYQFILAQGILGGACLGFLFTPATSAVNQYFAKKRGQAMGIVAVGSSIGGVLFPIALRNAFDSHLGFGWGVRTIGFVVLALLSIACVLVKERLPPRKGAFFLPEAFLNPAYSFLVAGIFMLIWSMFIPYFFVATFAITQAGMSETLAFYLLSVLNAASVVGRFTGGMTADRLGWLNMLVFIAVSTGVIILCWPLATSSAGLFVWAAMFGGFSGAVISLFPAALAHIAPKPQVIGTYMGQAMGVISLAGLTGTPIAGAILSNHGWWSVSTFGGVIMMVAAVLITIARFLRSRDWRAVI